jgi:hypothetical protein
MPLFFRIRNGRYSGASDHGTELTDRDAACKGSRIAALAALVQPQNRANQPTLSSSGAADLEIPILEIPIRKHWGGRDGV